MSGFSKMALRHTPVSYTHLDVYKRQAYSRLKYVIRRIGTVLQNQLRLVRTVLQVENQSKRRAFRKLRGTVEINRKVKKKLENKAKSKKK